MRGFVSGDEWERLIATLPRGLRVALERLLLGTDSPVSDLHPAPPEHRDPGSPAAPPGRLAWFALFEAVATLTRWVSERTRLVIINDDAHRLDDSSAQTLRELAKELQDAPITVIAAVREPTLEAREAARRAVDDYAALPRVQALELKPLSRSNASELARVYGYRGEAEALDRAYAVSAGNPLFLNELVYRLAAGTLDLSQPHSHLGPLVRREVARLPASVAELVRTAAILGSEFLLSDLAAAAAGEDIAGLISQAEQSGVISAREDESHVLGFRHQIVRDAIVAGLSQSDRAERAEAAARRLEAAYDADAANHAERLSELFLRGFSQDALRSGVRYGILAAERSAAALAWEDAANQADWLISQRRVSLSDREYAECRRVRGVARYMLGARFSGLRDLYQASHRYVSLGDAGKLVSILTTFSSLDVGDVEVMDMARTALDLLPATSAPGALAAVYYAAGVHHGLGDYHRAAQLMEAAFPVVDAVGDPNLSAAAHSFFVQSLIVLRRFHEASVHLSFPPPPGGGIPDARLYWNFAHAELRMHEGKPEATRAYHEASAAIGRESGDYSLVGPAYHLAARGALRQGDWDAARRLADSALHYNPSTTAANMPYVASCYHVGDVDAGDQRMDSMARVADDTPPGRGTIHTTFATLAALRRITTGEDRYGADARRHAKAILALEHLHPHITVRAGYALAELAHAEWERTGRYPEQDVVDGQRALTAFQRLAALHDHYVHYALGLLARCCGDLDSAATRLREAVAAADRYADAAARPWMRARLAAVLREIAPSTATEQFHRAYAMATDLGMKPLVGILEDHLLLSSRELQILRLVAQGLQAKEIADALQIRASTVHNHVQQVFAKTGTGNRIEAVRWARDAGVLAPGF
jgi:DNA-binding NarL/FixJ family response regulator